MRITSKILSGSFSLFGAIVISAATVKPHDADTNIAAWLKAVGVHKPPAAFATSHADQWAFWLGLILLSIGVFGLFEWAIPRVFSRAVRRVEMQPLVVVLRGYIDRHIHHKELAFQGKGTLTFDKKVERAADRDASLREGLAYAAFGDWNNRTNEQFESGDSDRFSDALSRFHQLAADGALRSWGIPVSYQATSIYQPIPKDHWGYAAVNFLDSLREKPWSRSRVPSALDYTDIRVNRAEFEREFPHV